LLHRVLEQPWLRLKRLAEGTEVGSSSSEGNPLNGGAAAGTGLTSTVSHLKPEVSRAGLAVGATVSISAGPLVLNSALEDLPDGPMETVEFLLEQGIRSPQRMDSGGEEGLIGIHVSDAGDDLLVAEQHLDGHPTPAQ